MAVAKIDENGRESITALLNTDGLTITRVEANALTNGLKVDDSSLGSDAGGNPNTLDDNFRPIFFAESSDGDGTLVPLYVNSSGELLVDSN